MKKFFVICLSVVMLFSTLLLCGFTRPIVDTEEFLQGTPLEVGEYVDNVYLNTSVGAEYWFNFFSTLPLDDKNRFYFIGSYSELDGIFVSYVPDNMTDTNGNYIPMYVVRDFDISGDLFIVYKNPEFDEYVMYGNYVSVIPQNKIINTLGNSSPEFNILFSSTPFQYPIDTLKINSTALPNEPGNVSGLYLNMYLTPDEVVSILDTLDWSDTTSYSPGLYIMDILGQQIPFGYTIGKDISGEYVISLVGVDIFGSQSPFVYPIFYTNGGEYFWNFSNFNKLVYFNPLFFPNSSIYLQDFVLQEQSIPSMYQNDKLSLLFSSTPFEIVLDPKISVGIIDVISTVFTEYVPMLAGAVLNMFTGIFWQNGAFTILGFALVTLVGIVLVSSIFYVVYRIFKGKIKKRL